MSDYRNQDARIVPHDPSASRSGSPEEIVSFPASVQARLDRAKALLRQDRPAEALDALRQAGSELARTAPELFVLLVAAQMGMMRITFEERETDTRTVRTDRRALGVRYGGDETTTTDTKVKRRTIGLE